MSDSELAGSERSLTPRPSITKGAPSPKKQSSEEPTHGSPSQIQRRHSSKSSKTGITQLDTSVSGTHPAGPATPSTPESKAKTQSSPSKKCSKSQEPEPWPSAPPPRSSISRSGRPRPCPYDRNYGICITVKGLIDRYLEIVNAFVADKGKFKNVPNPDVQTMSDAAQLLHARLVTLFLLPMQEPSKTATADSITDTIKPILDEVYLKVVPTLVKALRIDGPEEQEVEGKEKVKDRILFIPESVRKEIVIHVRSTLSALIRIMDHLPPLCQAFGHLMHEKTKLQTEPYRRMTKDKARSEILKLSGIIEAETTVLQTYSNPDDIFVSYLQKLTTHVELVDDAIRELNEDDGVVGFDDGQDGFDIGSSPTSKTGSSLTRRSSDKGRAKETVPAGSSKAQKSAHSSQPFSPSKGSSKRRDSRQKHHEIRIKITSGGMNTIAEFFRAVLKMLRVAGSQLMTKFVPGREEAVGADGRRLHILDCLFVDFGVVQEETDEVAGAFYEGDYRQVHQHMQQIGQMLEEVGVYCQNLYALVGPEGEVVLDDATSTLALMVERWRVLSDREDD